MGALVENISFLNQFANQGRTLSEPFFELLPLKGRLGKDDTEHKRALSFNEERRLAEVFALVLATTDKPSRVVAVCIEEQANCSGIIVRFAANVRTSEEEKVILFNKIINAARCEKGSDQEWPLLNEIVKAHQLRILRRLRSKHGPKPKSNDSSGQPILEQLHSAITKIPKSNRQSDNYQQVRRIVELWVALFRKLECLPASDALSKKGACILVKLILSLSSSLNVIHVAKTLSMARAKDSPWPNSNYERVLRAYKKISHYKSAAEYIEFMVRRHPTWELQFANNGPFELHAKGAQPVGIGNLGLYQRSITDASAKKRKEFQSTVSQRLGKSSAKVEMSITKGIEVHKKVHAEIQLLYHYAQHSAAVKPRVLCSNKEACYLCHLFITVHARFHTPRSHGNFYPEWRLPRMDEVVLPRQSMAQMQEGIKQFNLVIEDRLRLLLGSPRAVNLTPSESSIFSIGSTLRTIPVNHSAAKLPAPISIVRTPSFNDMEIRETCHELRQSGEHKVVVQSSSNGGHNLLTPTAITDEDTVLTLGQASTLEYHAADANRSSLANINLNAGVRTEITEVLGATTGQTYYLKPGKKVKLNIHKGNSVHLILPRFHFEFIFESTEVPYRENAFAVFSSEWLVSQDLHPHAANIDIDDLKTFREVDCSNITEKEGLIIHGRGQIIFMHVHSTLSLV
ncbi:hypothetical protein EJ08DRAFT_360601 [Tothia fuscella]|uniref:Uncharacterized protein n=1 Tax=Tothia fuscella TaxID=1048955 RepID=A0A9P4NLH6_9PEZI|nr:hypothetical protein EJ08DRAFT_360601 [Tothia fuscella]